MAPHLAENLLQLGLFNVIETVLNAGFLNNAHMVAGPSQALMGAGIISLTNIAASTAGGYFIGRWLSYGLNTSDPDEPDFKKRRNLARSLFAPFVGLMGFFHVSVGLIRAQESLHTIEHSIARYIEIVTTPEALFLVIVGIVMSCVSWKKGLSAFDDPYPGYGDRQHGVEEVVERLEGTLEDLREQINVRFEEKLDEVRAAEKAGAKTRAAYNRAVEDYLNSARMLESRQRQAETRLRAQVAQIAHHHLAARGERSSSIPESALDPFIRFDAYRLPSPPAFLPAPDYSPVRAKLTEAKAEALKHLTTLYEHASKGGNGDKP